MNPLEWAAKLKDLPLESAVFVLVIAVVITSVRWLASNSWSFQVENEEKQMVLKFAAKRSSGEATTPVLSEQGNKKVLRSKKTAGEKNKIAAPRRFKG